jgi:outer membrane lipoprotein-sorting protein
MNKKNNMKKYIILTISIFYSISYSQVDTDAEKLLNKVSDNIKSYDNIYINYTYTLDNLEEDINYTNRGSFVTENDNWRFEMLGITRIFDGNKLYTISPDDEEVTISSQNPEDETTITPNKMLYFYEDGYYFEMGKVKFIGNTNFRKKIQYVKLIPMDSEADIKYIDMGIDTEFNQIYEVIETGKNETITTISIIDFEFNVSLNEELFIFDSAKYEGFYMNILD